MANRKNKYLTTRKVHELSDWQHSGLFVLGIVCCIYTAAQYNATIIPFEYILYFFICIGSLGSILSYKLLPSNSNSFIVLLKNFVLRAILFGIFLTPLFLLTNTYLSNEKPYRITTSIREKHEGISHRKDSPYIIAELEGFEKKIYIHEYPFEEIVMKNNIMLQLKKGFWGFPIIDYERIQIGE